MITYAELEASGLYEEDLERIEKRGRDEGIEQGIGQGEGRMLRLQLEQRFGPLPFWALEKIQAADRATVETWGVRLLDTSGARLEDFLA